MRGKSRKQRNRRKTRMVKSKNKCWRMIRSRLMEKKIRRKFLAKSK